MAYQTLYRKYRPKTFELVYGQDTIVKTLKNVIKNQKLSHAYLFTGPRGTGKTSSAKLFAKAINCLNNVDGDACNNCEQCNSFNNNSNPDIIEIDAASNNGVDEIREIKNKVSLVPSSSKYKVYIIDEVHMLSIGAFNALLKTLEEPPEYVIFILATTEPHKLPATVISRCQRFDFKSISSVQMKKCLTNIIDKENIKIDEDALDEIINNSSGGLRDAIGMLDQAFAFSDKNITLNDINELSGNISNSELYELFEDINFGNYQNIVQKTEKLSEMGKDFCLVVEKMISFVRKGIIYKKTKNENVIDLKEKTIIQKIDDTQIYIIMDMLSEILINLQKSNHKMIIFEVKMLQLLDKLNYNANSLEKNNIETLEKEKVTVTKLKKDNNVPRETSCNDEIKLKNVVSRGTLNTNIEPDVLIPKELLNDLKKVRINNILKESTKKDLSFVSTMWENIKDFLFDEKYKICAGLLVDSKPIAASSNGIIIILPTESSINRIEKNYDKSKEILSQILGKKYKLVYILDSLWKNIRPEYVMKVKNNELEFISEEYYLEKINMINKNRSVNAFNDLIEMEEEK